MNNEFSPRERALRVAHIIGGGDTGGAMTHLLPLLASLRQQGVDVQLICLGEGGLVDAARDRGLPTTVIRMSGPFDLRVIPGLLRALRCEKWDIVHTHGARANLPVRAFWRLLGRGSKLAVTVHSDLLFDYASRLRGRLWWLLDRLSIRVVDLIVVVSEDLRRRLLARGYPESRMFVVRPGLELDPARPRPEERAAAGPLAPLPEAMARIDSPDAVWAGTVARLVPVKDIGLMLRAFARVAEAMPEARLAIVGDGPERVNLEQEADRLGLTGRVAFTGRVKTIWPALRRMSVFVLTSSSEGLPLSIMEAMSTGLPVVATDVGGVCEVVQEGVTGFVVPRREGAGEDFVEDALATRIISLFKSPDLCLRMGQAGAFRVEQEFSPAAAARQYLQAYQRLIAEERKN